MPEQELPSSEGVQATGPTPSAKSRLIVVETIYHQEADGVVTTLLDDASRYSRNLISDEQPYQRNRTLRQDWEPLDVGWVPRCGMLMLRNNEGRFAVVPTPTQRASVMRRIIEVSFGDGRADILVPPQETCRFYPRDASQIRLRCASETARYTLALVPE